MQKIQGFVEQGNTTLTITGAAGTISRKVQGSYPSATVTVYAAGTVTLSTIYADNASTPKANPFTSASDGTWFFYAANGRYDVQFSGAGIAAPFTIGDVQALDSVAPFSIRDASQFPGANWGAKVQAAHDNLPSTGGEVDATALEGAQSITSTVIFTKPIYLRVGASTVSATVLGIDIQTNNCTVIGKGWESIFKMASANSLFRMNGVTGARLEAFRLDGAARGFAADAITVGIAAGVTNEAVFEDLYFADIQGSALAVTSTSQFNDWRMTRCVFDNCGTGGVPCMNLAGFIDTARLLNNQWEGFLGTGLLGSANCQRIRVFGDKFHGDTPSNTNIAIDWSGFRSEFIGNQFNFIQGTDQILLKNVDNSFIGNEHTDPATTTNCYNLSSSGNRNRIIGNEISGPTVSTGIAVKLDAIGDNLVTANVIRNAGASAGFFAIKEVNAADRNLVSNNICINAGTVETITGVNSLFSDNGALDSQALVRRTQKFTTGDAPISANAGDAAIKRTGSNLGVLYFDDQKAFIVGYGNSGGDKIEAYVNATLRMTLNATKLSLAGIYYDTTGTYRVNGTQVVGAQGALIADVTGSAAVTYSATEQAMLNSLKATVNTVLARLRAHGLIAT